MDGVYVAWLVILGGAGLIVGSFLNVVIYRVPADLSIVRPGSACPTCHTPIAPRDNIPILSWLLLRGRCRSCGMRISVRYPLVEGLTGVLWVALGWWAWGTDGIDPLLPLVLVLGSAGIALAFIDVDHHRLPDSIVLPLYPVTVVGLVLDGLLSDHWPWQSMLIGAGAWLVLIGGLWFFSGGRGMGFGDVKLAPVLGATLGWVGVGSALVGLMAAFVLGGVAGVLLLILRRAGRRSQIPFGPYLLVGALVGLFWGGALWDAYVGSLGL
ncbi:MAG: prepilin peptidase [Actinobacteria bacterium]|nr:prepilin peptidase [Actinomycetota bacterium]